MYTVYVLYSHSANKHYTGYTSSLKERMMSHNELGNDWTARHRPWQLIYTREFETKTYAIRYERWLKTGTGRDFVKGLPH